MESGYDPTFDYQSVRVLTDGRTAGLKRFLYTWGLVVGISELQYESRYCYPDRTSAEIALAAWDGNGDPSGPWIKQKGAGIDRGNPNSFKSIPITVVESGSEKARRG